MSQQSRFVAVIGLVMVGVVIGATVTGVTSTGPSTAPSNQSTDPTTPQPVGQALGATLPGANTTSESLSQFESATAFTTYVQRGQQLARQHSYVSSTPRVVEQSGTLDAPQAVETGASLSGDSAGTVSSVQQSAGPGAAQPERVSDTNVQEQGLDEPDILKTDGTHVYYAPEPSRDWREEPDSRDTHIIAATPPRAPTQVASVESSGRLFRTGDRLVVIGDDELVGYNVTDPDSPQRVWDRSLDDAVVTARLMNGSMYLVTESSVSLEDPCPVKPMGDTMAIPCTEVYHPDRQAPVDATYTALSVDPTTGTVGNATSFVGTSDTTAVYMSSNGLYVTYTQQANRGRLRIDFLLSEQRDRLPGWVEQRLTEIRGYNISTGAKRSEANRVLQQWYHTLGEDERETMQSQINNEYQSYLAAHQRQLVTTGVVKLTVGDGDLAVETVGTVPGEPLNQFSLDEHDGTLRITTTIPEAGTNESRNDLYVLDNETLDRRGAVQGMGVTERVYSVRYVEDTAYVVTYRRIDPFHVVDLSNPDDPAVTGELKLPGFSSYLHPVDEDHVLGIGEQNGQVKAVLFDVADPSQPVIDDSYILDSRWSAISESHHAFLLDRRHGVFFLPTGDGGNVFDYTNGTLSLETAVATDGAARRAMYIDDYMYVFGDEEFAVIDETTWNRIDTVQLP